MRDEKREPKEYLGQIYKIDNYIKFLEGEILELTTMAEGGAINYEERVQTSGRASTESIMCSIVDRKSLVYDMLNKKLRLKDEISSKIYELYDKDNTQVYQAILFARYVACLRWDEISNKLGYSIRRVHDLHGRALKSFGEKVDY